MNAKTVRMNSILTSAMLFLYAGCGVLSLILNVIVASSLSSTSFSLPSGIFLCLAVMLPTVLLLIYGIKQAKRKQGVFGLIFSILTLIVSVIWMIACVLNWVAGLAQNLIIEFYYRLNIAMSMGDLLTLLSYISVVYMLFTTIVALYLLAVYAISVLRAKQKWLQIKAELHKPAVALIILIPNLLSLINLILGRILMNNVESGIMDLNAYVTYLRIYMYSSFALEMLLAIALAVFVLVFGLIIKKQATEQPEAAQPAPQAEQSPSAFDGIPLPAGVNPDDL